MTGFHPDVENVVNGYFESLFAGQLSPEDLVKALKNLKMSSNIHERQIFDCLIRNLFEEFKFFPNYPEKELETVAVFVGQIIASDILHPTSQSTALSFMLEAMKKPPGSRLFQFAQIATVHFYRRIPEWAQFMESLTRSPNYDHLPEIVRSHLASAHRDDAAAASQHVDSLKAALSAGPVKEPPEKLRERIHFALNNLTEDNLLVKAEDVRALLTVEYFQWFVEYLMSERIILENNLHSCYHELIVSIDSPGLLDLFMSTSLAKARRLLLSFESLPGERRDSIQLRSILKNLAQWIGLLFFTRDRPIMRRDLCVKSLLTAQVSNEYYTFILPFTCKLLEKTTLSSVLLPSNPWISSLLRLLVEIYVYVDLKLNSKFEIELLFKSLGVDMKTVPPSNVLRRKLSRPPSVPPSINSPSMPYGRGMMPSAATINELALAEIGPAQVERVCTIAAKTIATLLQKDIAALGPLPRNNFAADTAAGVASALFESTSRDAIRSILFATYRKYLSAAGIPFDEGRLIELVDSSYPTVISCTHDMIAKNMAARQFPQAPPPTPSPPGLVVNPAAVLSAYNELTDAVNRTSISSIQVSQPQMDVSGMVVEIIAEIEKVVSTNADAKSATSVGQLGAEDEIKALMKRLVTLAAAEPTNRDEACLVISQKLVQLLFRTNSTNNSPLLIDIAILLLAKIFEYSSRVSKEVTNWILVSTDERKYNVAAMAGLLSSGLVYVLDFDVQLARQIESGISKAVPFAVELIRKCIFSTPPIAAPYDLVYSLESLGRVLKRAASAIANLPAHQQQLGQEAKDIMSLMEDISKRVSEQPSGSVGSDVKLREVVSFWFSDWFRLCQYPSDTTKQVASFLSQLAQKEAFFKRPDKAAAFFRVCSEVAVELFLHQKHAPSVLSLRGVECFVRLSIGLATLTSPLQKGRSGGLIGEPELLRIAMCEFAAVLMTAIPQQPITLRALSRLLSFTLSELAGGKSARDGMSSSELLPYFTTVSDLLDALNPCELPCALAAWLEAVSSKHFLTTWLFVHPEEGSAYICRTLTISVDFLSDPSLVNGARSGSLVMAYQAILRLFVGVAHDRPDLLLSVSKELLFRLDPHYIQLRNLLLATIPSSMALPDPFAPDFVFDKIAGQVTLSAVQLIPQRPTSGNTLMDAQSMAVIEAAVGKCISGASFDTDAFARLVGPKGIAFSHNLFSNISQRSSVVTVERLADGINKSIKSFLSTSPPQVEQVYLLLFALTDNLRFPCAETHFFIRLFISLFHTNPAELVRESITRVLLERLIVHKPHPWGLIVAFLEIIKRPDFWKCQFTSKTPEIRRMFESVAKTCGNVAAVRVK